MSISAPVINQEAEAPQGLRLEPEAKTVRSLAILGFNNCSLAFARRVRGAGVRVHVIELVNRPRAFSRPSNAVDPLGTTLEWSVAGTPLGLAAVQDFVERVQADAILTTDDFCLTWLGKHRNFFEPRCRVLAPDPAVLEALLDKSHQIDLAAQSGFDLLPTWSLTTLESIAAIPEDSYPVVIRPSQTNSSRPAFKAKVLDSRVELTRLYKSTEWLQSPVVQPFCLGPNYVLHGVRAESGQMLALKFFKAYRKYQGFTTSMEPAALPAALEWAARLFVGKAGLTGPFHFELVRAESGGPYYFLEINCRLGGTTGKAVRLGFDEPRLTLEAFNARTPTPLPALRARRQASTATLNLAQAVNHLRNRRDPLAYPRLPWLKSIVASLSEAIRLGDQVLTLRDPRVYLWFVRGKMGG